MCLCWQETSGEPMRLVGSRGTGTTASEEHSATDQGNPITGTAISVLRRDFLKSGDKTTKMKKAEM